MERMTRRRGAVMGVFVTVLAVSASLPSLAFGGPLGDVAKGLGLGGNGGGGGSAAPAAGVPGEGSGYQPPLHGTNPHGQGSVGTVDLEPTDSAPVGGDPSTGDEEIIVGQSRGEQNADGSYQGRVTILHLNLFGLINETIGIETAEGESADGPLAELQVALNAICTGSGNTICLTLLAANSTTTSNGSSNSFQTAGASLGDGALDVSVAGSRGEIGDDGTCQTSSGSSSVVDASALGGAVTADVLQSRSDSVACNDGRQTQTNDSEVLNLLGFGVPVPADGCADGTPDSVFTAAILATVCNADDSNGAGEAVTQAGAPYGVREGLTAFVLGDVLKMAVPSSESRAVAPPPTGTTPSDEDELQGSTDVRSAEPGAGDPGAPPVGDDPQPLTDPLPFTGVSMAVLAPIGAGLLLAGLAVSSARRRRAA